ncbi:MAG: L-histidine N(alpha)-methyltransferase [Gammaproteobacteria bacterium]
MDIETESEFASDTLKGLSKTPKSLSCKWFYDENGSRLFEEITRTPEYYPTRVETRLLMDLVRDVAELIPDLAAVIEPGSGSSNKTRLLLASQPNLKTYVPIDISEEFLLAAANHLKRDFPALAIAPLAADFTASLPPIGLAENMERLVFFPGSTIGNFAPGDARRLLGEIKHFAGKNAWLLIGVDMTQNEELLIPAYNDACGITAKFNQNLLLRVNRELGGDFEPRFFRHRAHFNRRESRVEMHLVSAKKQSVTVNGHFFSFEEGETIHTENCYKYSREAFEAISRDSGWHLRHNWEDRQESNFGVFLFKSVDQSV